MPTEINEHTADWIIRSLIRDLRAGVAADGTSHASTLTPEDLLFLPWLQAVDRVVASGDPVDAAGLSDLVLSLLGSNDPRRYMFGAWLGRAVDSATAPDADSVVTQAIADRFDEETDSDRELGLFHQLTARVPAGHPLRDSLVDWAVENADDLIREQLRTFPGDTAEDLRIRMAQYPPKAWVYMFSAHVLPTDADRRAFLESYLNDADTAVALAARESLARV